MHRLLIVDDERIITNLLAEMFANRKELDLDVYKAYSAREALLLLEKIKIDILLTDVFMPGMSGIELQEETARLWPHCRVIFLTAHDCFENIRSAMRNSAVDFVVKSEDDDVLIESVRKAIDSIQRDSFVEDYLLRAESSLKAALPVLQQTLMQDLLDGEVDFVQIERVLQEYEINLTPLEPVLLLLGRTDKWDARRMRKDIYTINRMTMEVWSGLCRCFAFSYLEGRYVVWLIQPLPDRSEQDALRLAHGDIEALQKLCREVSGISVSMIAADGFSPWNDISSRFDILRGKLESVFGLSDEMAIMEQNNAEDTAMDSQPSVYDVSQLLKTVEILRIYLECGQQDEFMARFDAFAHELPSEHLLPEETRTEIILHINLMLYSISASHRLSGELAHYFEPELLIRADPDMPLTRYIGAWRDAARFIFMKRDARNLSNANVVFGRMRAYIHDHIADDLSLHQLARVVYFSPAYLSRLFKSVTGKSVSEYISSVKIQRACELLRSTNMRIAEIASAVGYENQQNFTRFFKKNMTMSPLEYREKTLFGVGLP